MEILFALFFLVAFFIGSYSLFRFVFLKFSNKSQPILEYLLTLILFITLFAFLVTLIGAKEYYVAIDPIDNVYTPLAGTHIATIVAYELLGWTASILLWLRNRRLPPILFVLCIASIVVKITMNTIIILQVADGSGRDESIILSLFPAISIIVSIIVLTKGIKATINETSHKDYHNKFLHYSSKLLTNIYLQPFWALLLLLPLVLIITVILTLFGQDTHAITKVFTDTATWRFSQQQHPPFLDHQGHYLCTVAARGHFDLVKPLRLGKRHGNTIIVNRQLLVANAFEQLLEEKCNGFHKIIRGLYDKYGYPFSKHICSPLRSDAIYLLMKPAEYFFIIILYLFCHEPEKRIAAQYL